MRLRTLAIGMGLPLAAIVAAGCMLIPPNIGFYFGVMPWVLVAAPIGVLVGCHMIALTQTPVCRFGAPPQDGIALYLMLVAMVAVAVGGLVAMTGTVTFGLPGGPAGSLVLAAAMAGVVNLLTIPGLGFEWVPTFPTATSGTKANAALWILKSRKRGAFGVSGSPPSRHLADWGIWGLGLVCAYIPVGAIAILPALLVDTAEVGRPVAPLTARWLIAVTAAMVLLFIRAANLAVARQLMRSRGVPTNGGGEHQARWISALAVGSAAVATLPALVTAIPVWCGFLALLVAFVASELAFFAVLMSDRRGLRWPSERGGDAEPMQRHAGRDQT